MSLFHSSESVICADYFGDELPLPLPAVKILENKKKNMDPKDTKSSSMYKASRVHVGSEEVLHSKDTTAKILNIGAATDNAVGQSKKGSRRYKAPGFTPAFDGLHPFEMFVSR